MITEQNVASRRVAEKLGMAVERPAVWGGQPMLMYTVELSEWGESNRMPLATLGMMVAA